MPEPTGFENQTSAPNPLEGESLGHAVEAISSVFTDVGERFLDYSPGGQYASEVASFAQRQAEQAAGEAVRLGGQAEEGQPTELASSMVFGFAFGLDPAQIGGHFQSALYKQAASLGLDDADRIAKYVHNVAQTMNPLDAADGMYNYLQTTEEFTPVELAILDSVALGFAVRRDSKGVGTNLAQQMLSKYTQMQSPQPETV